MDSRYLQENPLSLLLEKGSPSIRYLVKRDLQGEEGDYDSLSGDPAVADILQKEKKGTIGSTRRFDLYYRGTQWYLAAAVEYGLDGRTGPLKETALHVAEETTSPDGGFRFNWKPPLPVACRTGDMVYYLSRVLGPGHRAVKRGVDWICEHQRHDGGWLHCPLAGSCDMVKLAMLKRAGSGLKREKNRAVSSCFYATAACMKALIAAGRDNRDVLEGGGDFFLNRRLFLGRGSEPIIPANAWNRDFRLLGYPVLCQYDILSGLDIVFRLGRGDDERVSSAFNLLMQKQNSNGTWNLEQTGTGMLFGPGDSSRVDTFNPMVTLRVLRFLKMMEEKSLS